MAFAYNNEAVTLFNKEKQLNYYIEACRYYIDNNIVKNFMGAISAKVNKIKFESFTTITEINKTITQVKRGLEPFIPVRIFNEINNCNSYNDMKVCADKYGGHNFDKTSVDLLDLLEVVIIKKDKKQRF